MIETRSRPGLFSDAQSPIKRRTDLHNTSKVKIQLNPTDIGKSSHERFLTVNINYRVLFTVPVYDGRNHIIDPNDGSLQQIGSSLPILTSEMSEGSLALVAYTANGYKKVKNSSHITNLALNINWAVLMATPLN